MSYNKCKHIYNLCPFDEVTCRLGPRAKAFGLCLGPSSPEQGMLILQIACYILQ